MPSKSSHKTPKKKGKPVAIEPEVLEPDPDLEEASDPEGLPEEDAEIIDETADPQTDLAILPSSQAVSISDPLKQYMEELRKFPLLTLEQEQDLVQRLRETGDIAAAKALVSANLRLVVKIAFEYRSVYANLLDLVQEGNIGLMKAVSKYDPTKGARLGYYASWWIRSYILKYLIDNFRLVKIGTTQAQKKLFYHLVREQQRLEAQGIFAAPKLLAEKLDVREKDVIEMQQRLSGQGSEVPLDAPTDPESERLRPIDTLQDTQDAADTALEKNELLELIRKNLPSFQKLLNEKETKILKERILSEMPRTLQEVAHDYGLTRERVRQIESRIIAKLRDYLQPALTGEKTESEPSRNRTLKPKARKS